RARADAQLLRRLIETFTQVDPAVGAEGLDRLAGLLVQRPEEAAVADEDAILVHRDAAVPEARRAGRAVARIEFPDLAAVGRVDRDHLQRRRRGVEHAVHDDRVALHLGALEGIVRVVGPRDAQ